MESIAGQMAENMKDSGYRIKCTVMVFIPGETVENTRANTNTTRSMDMVFIRGPTVVNMMDLGQMVFEMVVAST
jgi:hypothetical protein